MIIRKVDSGNDWNFGKGIADYARDAEAINENVKTRILSWLNDCFFALNDGVDWKSRLDVGQKENLILELRATILQSYGVVGINDVSVDFSGSTRLFTVTYDMITFFSQSFQSELSQAIGA